MTEIIEAAAPRVDVENLVAYRRQLLASVALADQAANEALIGGGSSAVDAERAKAVDLRLVQGIDEVLGRHGIDIATLDSAVA